MTQQNKKRKHEESSTPTSQVIDSDHHMGLIAENVENIGSELFEEMTVVNDKLLSLSRKVKLVGHQYFVTNNSMIDEFLGNIHAFVSEMVLHRRKVSSEQLGSDNWFHIFQFLEQKELLKTCVTVSKTWRETVKRFDFDLVATARNIKYLLNGSYNITKLKLESGILILKELSNCKKLDSLTCLDLQGNNLGIQSIRLLKKCSFKNLTELDLGYANNFGDKEVKELVQSTVVSNLKKLKMMIINPSKECYQVLEETKYLNQLTHLSLAGNRAREDYSFAELLKKDQYEYLALSSFYLKSFPKGSLNLTTLEIRECYISDSDLVNLIDSSKMPKLTTLIGQISSKPSNPQIEISPKSKSSLTCLTLIRTFIGTYPSLIDHCPNLKRLEIPHEYCESYRADLICYENCLNNPNLSNLEYLDISKLYCMEPLFEIIFKSPIYSNLETLVCHGRLEKKLN